MNKLIYKGIAPTRNNAFADRTKSLSFVKDGKKFSKIGTTLLPFLIRGQNL